MTKPRIIAYCMHCTGAWNVPWATALHEIGTRNCEGCAQLMEERPLTFIRLPITEEVLSISCDVRYRRKNYKLTPSDRQRVLEMYATGEKVEYIARSFNIRRETVSTMARRAGLPPRQRRMEATRATEV